MALAVGNSIYIAEFLVAEPRVQEHEGGNIWEITRITGSLGRSEMVMLVSLGPPPPLRALDYENWDLVNHNAFDGACHDCFQTRLSIYPSLILRYQ
jgi:hypothetical protein